MAPWHQRAAVVMGPLLQFRRTHREYVYAGALAALLAVVAGCTVGILAHHHNQRAKERVLAIRAHLDAVQQVHACEAALGRVGDCFAETDARPAAGRGPLDEASREARAQFALLAGLRAPLHPAGSEPALARALAAGRAVEAVVAQGDAEAVRASLAAARGRLRELEDLHLRRQDAAVEAADEAELFPQLLFSLGATLGLGGLAFWLLWRRLQAEMRRRAQVREGLAGSEARYRALVEHAQEALVVFDLDTGRFVDVNDNACRLFRMSREALLQTGPAELSPRLQPDGRVSAVAARQEVQRALEGQLPTFEWVHKDSQGREIPCEVRLVGLPSEQGKLVKGSLVDVTRRRQAEAREEEQERLLFQADRLVTLGTLVSGVAHEINNPNQVVMLNAPLLEEIWHGIAPFLAEHRRCHPESHLAQPPQDEILREAPRLIREIRESSERIRLIVNELRRYVLGMGSGSTGLLCLNDAVRSALGLLGNPIRKATRRLELSLDEALPPVRGDRPRLEQVIVNLLLNACQALDSPEQAIRVRTASDPATGRVLFEVSDEGGGIAAADLGRVTDPFFTTRRGTGGTGLGLAVASRIVQEHGGSLEFRSHPGQGTTVRLRLPAAQPSPVAA